MARSWVRDYIDNFREWNGPLAEKVRLGVSNTARRLRGQACCGRPGEPGC
jgi:hypothetical protein